jgi:hypothetical protein
MLNKNYDELNNYLGFNVRSDAEVPQTTGKTKVIRKKSTGDWRHWFTDEDAKLLKPAYSPYMELIGYDCTDWTLNANPIIEPEYASEYMQRLAQRTKRNIFMSTKEKLVKRFF